ncbi:MAG TPA: hypothetical protein VK464_04085, partial [Symbiobacteriaceae bacterium]|nr:hypothetical protein [Symbiobacteriaceae bacterium]
MTKLRTGQFCPAPYEGRIPMMQPWQLQHLRDAFAAYGAHCRSVSPATAALCAALGPGPAPA